MIKIETSIDIAAPIDLVWAITTNVRSWPEWTPTVSTVKPVDDGPMGVGSSYLVKQPLQREALWQVTQFDPGHKFAWEQQTGRQRFKAMHILETFENITRSTLLLESASHGNNFLELILRPVLLGALKTENRSLKRFAERIG